MAIIIDEPTPISRSDAGKLLATPTSLGIVVSRTAGVLSRAYIGGMYGNEIAKVGETTTLEEPNLMANLEYVGTFILKWGITVCDTNAGNLYPSQADSESYDGAEITITVNGQAPYVANFPIGSLPPFYLPVENPFGNYGANCIDGESSIEITVAMAKAQFVAGIIPEIDLSFRYYSAFANTPSSTIFTQFYFTPAFSNSGIVLPPPYITNSIWGTGKRYKPCTTKDFSLNNLTRLQTPYNLLPAPFAGAGYKNNVLCLTTFPPNVALNCMDILPDNTASTNASLVSFFRQSKTVGDGGFAYVYNPADGGYPVAGKIFDFNGKIKIFPPLYYTFGVDPASSISWGANFPSYSANPLDSRP